MGNELLLTLYKELLAGLLVARLQESREAGGVAAWRTETEMAVGAGRPRGREQLAAGRLAPRQMGFQCLTCHLESEARTLLPHVLLL